jgi:hypothetical protein
MLLQIFDATQYALTDSKAHHDTIKGPDFPPLNLRRTLDMTSNIPPASPTESFTDLSDDEEHDYNTITQTATGKGVKLLFSKSKVYVHPSPSSKDNIPGFIALVQEKAPAGSSRDIPNSSLLLAWHPETSLGEALGTYTKVDLNEDESPRQSFLVPPPPTAFHSGSRLGTYAFSVPVSQIYSILIRPPSIGWWFGSIVINTRHGESLPALFFHDSECQSTILQKKKRLRESFDPFSSEGGLFWGGDEILRWLRRYVKVERSGAEPSVYLVDPSTEDMESFGNKPVTVGFPNAGNGRAVQEGQLGQSLGSGRPGSSRDGGMDPFTRALKEARWTFLEKLSQVTKFSRQTAQDLLNNPNVPPQVRNFIKTPEVQTIQDEYDSARLYLARWAMTVAEQSEKEKKQKIWTAKDVLEMEESAVGEFEILDIEAGNLSISDRRKPVTLEEWHGFFDKSNGRLICTQDEVKERIFHGGLDSEDGVRKEAWLFLLGVFEWDSTEKERKAVMATKRDVYIRLKGKWWERLVELGGQGEEGDWWREQRGRIGK